MYCTANYNSLCFLTSKVNGEMNEAVSISFLLSSQINIVDLPANGKTVAYRMCHTTLYFPKWFVPEMLSLVISKLTKWKSKRSRLDVQSKSTKQKPTFITRKVRKKCGNSKKSYIGVLWFSNTINSYLSSQSWHSPTTIYCWSGHFLT